MTEGKKRYRVWWGEWDKENMDYERGFWIEETKILQFWIKMIKFFGMW